MDKAELLEIVKRHKAWMLAEAGGERADLRGADLCGADLRGADLCGADLRGADLSSANLSYANLSYANLSYADLRSANLRSANLRYANLSYANLSYANLSYADLSYAVGGAGDRIQCLQIHPYKIIVLDKEIAWGGCTKKTVQEWLDYDGADLPDDQKEYLATITKPFIRMVTA